MLKNKKNQANIHPFNMILMVADICQKTHDNAATQQGAAVAAAHRGHLVDQTDILDVQAGEQ